MQAFTLFLSQHMQLSIAAAILFVLILLVEWIRAQRSNINVTAAQATQLINHEHAVVIDIRPADVYKQGHIIDAYSIPGDVSKENKKLEKFRTKPIIIVCQTGLDAQKIASSLVKGGYNAVSLTGGMRAWTAAQMPIIKG